MTPQESTTLALDGKLQTTETSGERIALVRLRNKEVSGLWEYLKTFIVAGTIPGTTVDDDLRTNILAALLKGDLWCWVLIDDKGPKAVYTALVSEEYFSKVRNLVVYSAWFRQSPNAEEVKKIVRSLLGQAKSQGCTKVAGYTNSTFVAKFLARLPNITPSIYVEVSLNG